MGMLWKPEKGKRHGKNGRNKWEGYKLDKERERG